MKKRFTPSFWATIAEEFATQSSCKKAQVGCLIIKDRHLISAGVNGTTSGDSNNCEDPEGQTEHWRVHHAERNALRRVTQEQAEGSDMYVTLAPCWECAKEIIGYKVSKLYYAQVKDEYEEVLEYLESMGVETERT